MREPRHAGTSDETSIQCAADHPSCDLAVAPFGAVVRLHADDQRFANALGAAIGRYPVTASTAVRAGSFSLRASTIADGPADPAWPVTAMHDAAGRVELWCGSGSMRVDVRASRGELALPGALLAIDDAVRLFVEGAVWSWLIGSGRLRAVHAGMVGNGRASALLRGASGAGKSTLTYACLRAGMSVASDDWVYAPARQRATELVGYPWRMFLVADAAARFDELRDRPLVAHPGSDRWKVAVAPSPAQQFLASDPAVVVFLDSSASLGLDAIGRREATRMFWASALESERQRLGRRWVGRLLDRPCYVLRRGADPNAAASLIANLVDSASPPGRRVASAHRASGSAP